MDCFRRINPEKLLQIPLFLNFINVFKKIYTNLKDWFFDCKVLYTNFEIATYRFLPLNNKVESSILFGIYQNSLEIFYCNNPVLKFLYTKKSKEKEVINHYKPLFLNFL